MLHELEQILILPSVVSFALMAQEGAFIQTGKSDQKWEHISATHIMGMLQIAFYGGTESVDNYYLYYCCLPLSNI